MLSLFSLVLLSLGLVSCFESKSVLTVNKDGSATIEESTLIAPQFKARLQAAAATDLNASAVLKTLAPDKPGAEERAAKLGEGISLKSLEDVSRPDGFTGVKVTYAVADIRKLRYLLPYNLKESADANARAMTFSLENDTLSVHSPPGGPKSDQPARPPVPKEKVIARVKG